ncbi:hypothetical protein Ae201684P_002972 [Aphanomyces euteiches]|nr:hypothetical protein Ae201684P_002972 [Aphanomyces euteiches]
MSRLESSVEGQLRRSLCSQLFIPLKPALPYPHAKIVRGIAEEIQDKHVVVRQTVNDQAEATTTNLPFDYLVLATGSSYTSPIKALEDTANNIRAASSVLVVGGGPVGVEVAAEIACAYSSKRVTILEGNPRLVHNSRLKDSFRQQLSNKLAQLDAKVMLGERLPERLTAHNFSATTLVTDFFFLCRQNTSIQAVFAVNAVLWRSRIARYLSILNSQYIYSTTEGSSSRTSNSLVKRHCNLSLVYLFMSTASTASVGIIIERRSLMRQFIYGFSLD